MIKLNRLSVTAALTGLFLTGMVTTIYAQESADSVQKICTQQAEEDGLTGEDKVNAIQVCIEEQSGEAAKADK